MNYRECPCRYPEDWDWDCNEDFYNQGNCYDYDNRYYQNNINYNQNNFNGNYNQNDYYNNYNNQNNYRQSGYKNCCQGQWQNNNNRKQNHHRRKCCLFDIFRFRCW